MAVTTTIARHYAWRNIIFAVVCLVLGLWGVYDYAVAIPTQERSFHRGEICRQVKAALEPEGWSEAARPARAAVTADIERILSEHLSEGTVEDMRTDELRTLDDQSLQARADEFEQAIDSIKKNQQHDWLMALLLFDQALQAGEPASYPLSGIHLLAHDVAQQGIDQVANVSRPNQYDRPTQWLFILCLPFVPWALWMYYSTKSRVYALDDDGMLHIEGRTWKPNDVADIDMDRWMSKSIAVLEHTDGTRITLDDYKHKDLHLIVGAVASRLYPDKWTEEAKIIKPAASDNDGNSDAPSSTAQDERDQEQPTDAADSDKN